MGTRKEYRSRLDQSQLDTLNSGRTCFSAKHGTYRYRSAVFLNAYSINTDQFDALQNIICDLRDRSFVDK